MRVSSVDCHISSHYHRAAATHRALRNPRVPYRDIVKFLNDFAYLAHVGVAHTYLIELF